MLTKTYSILLASGIIFFTQCTELTTIIELKDDTAPAIISQGNKPIVIDFYGDWCPPCKQMAPLFEQIASEDKGMYVFSKANFNAVPKLAAKYGVVMLPTFVVVRGEKLLGCITGMHTKEALKQKIDELVAGVDLSKLDKKALMIKLQDALKSFSVAEIKSLVAAGADVNGSFEDGTRPILFACIYGLNAGDVGLDVIKLLLELGVETEFMYSRPGITEEKIDMLAFVKDTIANFEKLKNNYEKAADLIANRVALAKK